MSRRSARRLFPRRGARLVRAAIFPSRRFVPAFMSWRGIVPVSSLFV